MNVITSSSTTTTTTTRSRPRQLLSSVRDELRERRRARAEERALERELASYVTVAEVDDLLGSLRGQDDAEVDRIRGILTRNLQHHQRTSIAS
jgi:hypothetical protein